MKSINIQYYALFRELAGKDFESIEVPFSSYKELYEMLSAQYKFKLPQEMIQLAVNDEFVSFDSSIVDRAKVVFIPPVAGG